MERFKKLLRDRQFLGGMLEARKMYFTNQKRQFSLDKDALPLYTRLCKILNVDSPDGIISSLDSDGTINLEVLKDILQDSRPCNKYLDEFTVSFLALSKSIVVKNLETLEEVICGLKGDVSCWYDEAKLEPQPKKRKANTQPEKKSTKSKQAKLSPHESFSSEFDYRLPGSPNPASPMLFGKPEVDLLELSPLKVDSSSNPRSDSSAPESPQKADLLFSHPGLFTPPGRDDPGSPVPLDYDGDQLTL